MKWFTSKPKTADEDARLKRTIELAEDLVNPHIVAAGKLKTVEEKREAITTLMMAMSYAICLVASRFLSSEPKTFAMHMSQFIENTMNTLKKAKERTDGRTSKEAGGGWDSIN